MDGNKNAKKEKSNNRSVWVFWLPLCLAIVIYLTISFIGNVLVIGTKLGTFHPVIEWGFYGSLMALFLWLISAPILSVLTAPVLALEDIIDKSRKRTFDSKTLRKIAKQLISSKVLKPTLDSKKKLEPTLDNEKKLADLKKCILEEPISEAEKKMKKLISKDETLDYFKMMILKELENGIKSGGDGLIVPLSMAITLQNISAAKIIHENAVLVLVSTAISQNGRLDAITVLVTNFRLVKSMVNHFGYRPPFPTLVKVYSQIFMAALIADELDDLDLQSLLGQSVSKFLSDLPLASIMAKSIFDGSINAMLTLRVGFVTRKYILNVGRTLTRGYVRKDATREARYEIGFVLADAVKVIPQGLVATVFDRVRKVFIKDNEPAHGADDL